MDIELLYNKAEKFLPWNLDNKINNTTIIPFWTNKAVYYFQEIDDKTFLIKKDINSGEIEEVLEYDEILTFFSEKKQKDIETLKKKFPFSIFSVNDENELLLTFYYEDYHWEFLINKKNKIYKKIKKILPGHLYSPNNQFSIELRDNNILLTGISGEGEIVKLTTEGEPYYNYGTSPETNTHTITDKLKNTISAPIAIWSPDSSKIVTHKLDQRKVKNLFLLQNVSEDHRPILHSYRMSFSGDENLPLAELVILDIHTKSILQIDSEPLLSPYLTPLELKWVWWSEDSKEIFFIQETRGAKEIRLFSANAETGKKEILIIESAQETYVEPSPHALWSPEILILKQNKIIWLSERSGYAHLYLIDKISKQSQPITRGNWCVRKIYFYDDSTNWLYFTATGYDPTIDPYYQQLFRCHLDGTELQCLTKENANHMISFSPSKDCFMDTYSTIDTPPITILINLIHNLTFEVAKANLSKLKNELNWVPPKRFCVKGRDDVTDIYGNIYFPSHFDKNKLYPIIDQIYPGPQISRTPISFSLCEPFSRSIWSAQALAELGFIVLHMDGMGTPGRSKYFHDITYKNMGDCGIPDHVAAIKQLAEKYSFMDINRVGITGYSGGGYATVRAMLLYPNFFKVGVSTAGNHDLRCYPANYGEKYNSLDTSTYQYQSNSFLAEKLEGKLLLIHGDMDDNVHPCSTFQLVDSLIKYNKDFEMIIMPNQNHSSTAVHPYYIRKQWDFFVKHLLYIAPPKNYRITEMT